MLPKWVFVFRAKFSIQRRFVLLIRVFLEYVNGSK